MIEFLYNKESYLDCVNAETFNPKRPDGEEFEVCNYSQKTEHPSALADGKTAKKLYISTDEPSAPIEFQAAGHRSWSSGYRRAPGDFATTRLQSAPIFKRQPMPAGSTISGSLHLLRPLVAEDQQSAPAGATGTRNLPAAYRPPTPTSLPSKHISQGQSAPAGLTIAGLQFQPSNQPSVPADATWNRTLPTGHPSPVHELSAPAGSTIDGHVYLSAETPPAHAAPTLTGCGLWPADRPPAPAGATRIWNSGDLPLVRWSPTPADHPTPTAHAARPVGLALTGPAGQPNSFVRPLGNWMDEGELTILFVNDQFQQHFSSSTWYVREYILLVHLRLIGIILSTYFVRQYCIVRDLSGSTARELATLKLLLEEAQRELSVPPRYRQEDGRPGRFEKETSNVSLTDRPQRAVDHLTRAALTQHTHAIPSEGVTLKERRHTMTVSMAFLTESMSFWTHMQLQLLFTRRTFIYGITSMLSQASGPGAAATQPAGLNIIILACGTEPSAGESNTFAAPVSISIFTPSAATTISAELSNIRLLLAAARTPAGDVPATLIIGDQALERIARATIALFWSLQYSLPSTAVSCQAGGPGASATWPAGTSTITSACKSNRQGALCVPPLMLRTLQPFGWAKSTQSSLNFQKLCPRSLRATCLSSSPLATRC